MGIWADLNAFGKAWHRQKRPDTSARQRLAECSMRVVASPGPGIREASWCGGAPPLWGEPGHSGQNRHRIAETMDGQLANIGPVADGWH